MWYCRQDQITWKNLSQFQKKSKSTDWIMWNNLKKPFKVSKNSQKGVEINGKKTQEDRNI